MKCNCKWCEGLLAIAIIVFAFVEASYSKWIIVIAAAIILLHAISCKCHTVCGTEGSAMLKAKKQKSKK